MIAEPNTWGIKESNKEILTSMRLSGKGISRTPAREECNKYDLTTTDSWFF
jgi:hypothetical protein